MLSMVRWLKFMPSPKGTDLVNDCVVFRKGLSKCIADPVVWIFVVPMLLRQDFQVLAVPNCGAQQGLGAKSTESHLHNLDASYKQWSCQSYDWWTTVTCYFVLQHYGNSLCWQSNFVSYMIMSNLLCMTLSNTPTRPIWGKGAELMRIPALAPSLHAWHWHHQIP